MGVLFILVLDEVFGVNHLPYIMVPCTDEGKLGIASDSQCRSVCKVGYILDVVVCSLCHLAQLVENGVVSECKLDEPLFCGNVEYLFENRKQNRI